MAGGGRVTDPAAAHDTRALEAILFVSDEPLSPAVISQALEVDRGSAQELCERLRTELETRDSGLILREVAGGWRLFTHPDAAPIVYAYMSHEA